MQTVTDYPSRWPRLLVTQKCDGLSGSFANLSSETTLWQSPHNSSSSRAFLAPVLSKGEISSYDDTQLRFRSVDTDFPNRAIRMNWATTAGAPISTKISAEWHCESDGTLRGTFKKDGDSEGWIGNNVTSTFSILRAQDESLIVHLVLEHHAVFPLGTGRSEMWMLFRVSDEAH